MRKSFCALAALAAAVCSCGQTPQAESDVWTAYFTGEVNFVDKAEGTEGSRIYHSIIADPASYIDEQAKAVLATLYFSPADSIVPVNVIDYTIEDVDGISAKDGGDGHVSIFYSTRHVEKSFADADTAKVLFETRGVLLHELTHAYQLEPQGIGDYGSSRVFWSFIEGMADAVRVANGGFGPDGRPKGGSYMDGYRKAGYFFVWLRDTRDPDFLRKFNASTLTVVPWSYNGALQSILGEDADVDALWHEYQVAMGDIEAEAAGDAAAGSAEPAA